MSGSVWGRLSDGAFYHDCEYAGSMKYLSLIFIVLVTGCSSPAITPDAFDHCMVDRSESWQLIGMDASLRETLLGLSYKNKTIRERMAMQSEHPVVDVWFANPKGEFQFCRYENILDSCNSNEKSARFHMVDGNYQGYQIVEKVCLIHNVRT